MNGSPGRIVSSIDELIGNTPLFRLSYPDLAPGARLLAKLEMFNPLGSVKDRVALNMIRRAELSGELRPGGTVIEATSGNTGIALAALCAARGYRCVVVMPDNATEERKRMLRGFGAEIDLTPHDGGLAGLIARAEQLREEIPGAVQTAQERNFANPAAHYVTTGPEIFEACGGEVDVLVCVVGTGGTLTGIGRYLRERRNVYVVAVEAAESPMISLGIAGPHEIAGVSGGIICEVLDLGLIDDVVRVSDAQAFSAARDLAMRTGLFVGTSAGAALHAAHTIATQPRWEGATVVTVLPDTGQRYLSKLDTATDTEERAA
ncbi:cysteine synthase family protein [Actinophytocola sp.]|uniref:PLP-dependent cysteine synthase family protein n=1 Tax=Actinophytocola sp. TaxID=1872138 RepID=UPI002D80E8D3|nr:cysteine synthase family protein [Actinophytocola sp.]HET9140737.1 cysteine synthase family protein [Actinophytocola sp.]